VDCQFCGSKSIVNAEELDAGRKIDADFEVD